MQPTDIKATDSGNPGAYMLKRWLEYSARGNLASPDQVGADTESDFEDFVIDRIRSMGYKAVPQVGSEGYRVDIGVVHPDHPGFIIGVECDGASYHSSRSARDRDRLRQEILEGLGWKIHRIWSIDWFSDPDKEAENLRKVIEDRVAEWTGKMA